MAEPKKAVQPEVHLVLLNFSKYSEKIKGTDALPSSKTLVS